MTRTVTPAEVRDFWFGADGTPASGTMRPEWFRKDAAFDAEIATRFGDAIGAAIEGGLLDWTAEPDDSLARILLLDQFTRNAFRDTPRAFAGDTLALAEARAMVALGQDMAFPPERRMFVYMPFEHAEDLSMQDDSVRLFGALAAGSAAAADLPGYAERHRAVVRRFGRFPHRNALLGRASTAEEIAFLREPGSRF